MGNKKSKNSRQEKLITYLSKNPFLTDDEIAVHFGVSVPTIRLDRLALGIPENKERVKNLARGNLSKLQTITTSEFIGQLLSIEPGKSAIALLETEEDMVFSKTKILRGHYVYSFAESLAIAVIDAKAALLEVANIKYLKPIYAGQRLVAIAEIKQKRDRNFIVWVKIKQDNEMVFRSKFILAALEG